MAKENAPMTEFSTETAASWMVPSCPAKSWVVAPMVYWQREVKIAGPAKYHSLLNSLKNSLQKSPTPFISTSWPLKGKHDGGCLGFV